MKPRFASIQWGLGLGLLLQPFASGAQMIFPSTLIRPAETPTTDETGMLFRAGLGTQAIDNVYGRSSGVVSDVVANQMVGASLRSSYSQQKLLLDGSVSDYRYQSHSDLDYMGTSLAGTWQWASGSNLFGALAGSRTVTQNAIGTTVNSTSRNLNTSQNTSALVGYDFGGGWQISGGALQASSENEQQVFGQALVSKYSGAFAAATYVFASGNSMSLRTLSGSGTNTYDYYVRSTEFRLDSVTNLGTTLGAQLNYWQQTYPSQSQYDFSGYMGRLSAVWVPTEKTSVQGALQRQLYGVPLSNAIYTVTDSALIAPSWAMTNKITLKGSYQRSIIRYEGDPGGGASGQVDNFQTFGVSLEWKPTDNTDVSLSYSQSKHRSGLTSADTDINIVSLMGRIAF
jgi:Putative beta-barrel porin 2